MNHRQTQQLTRRQFVNGAMGSAASFALAGIPESAMAYGAATTPLRGRFVTHVSVVRVNQIEVTPTRSIGEDEVADNSPEHIRSRREALREVAPAGR